MLLELKFNSYPILNEKLVHEAGIGVSATEYYYNNNSILYKHSINGNKFILEDKELKWNKERDELIIKKNYTITNPKVLFGIHGIAPSNATIGIAFNWCSKDSVQRKAIQIGEFNATSPNHLTFNLDYSFGSATLRGEIFSHSFLYIKDPGISTPNESFLANKMGLNIGVFDDYECIKLDGTGSSFPIINEHNGKNKPLWSIINHCSNIKDNNFNDSIAIEFNIDNSNYDNFKKDVVFRNEVITSALICIIADLKFNTTEEDWNSVMNNDSLKVGSVGSVLFYFKDALRFNFDSFNTLSLSIREYLDKNNF